LQLAENSSLHVILAAEGYLQGSLFVPRLPTAVRLTDTSAYPHSMATTVPSRLHIAVIGGGLAGTTLANALIKIPHIKVQVFEAAASFSERGAAVALSTNALEALEHIFSLAGKEELLKKAGAVPLNSSRSVVVCLPLHRTCH
jgi:hypothetical protein